MAESSPKGWKTLREKEKLLVMSNFCFSHSVFKRLDLQTPKSQGLFGKGLIIYHTIPTFNNLEKESFLKQKKGENAGKQHFLLYSQCFQKASFQGAIKDCTVQKGVQEISHISPT